MFAVLFNLCLCYNMVEISVSQRRLNKEGKSMQSDDNKALNDEFGKFMGRFGLSRSGQAGAWLAAKFLPNNSFQLFLDIAADSTSVLNIVMDILTASGELINKQELSETSEVRAIVGSGAWNMNPALVKVQVNQISPNQTHVTISGIAKEGLIKQRAGEKAVRRLAQQLVEAMQ